MFNYYKQTFFSHDPNQKCFDEFLLRKMRKKRVFCHFWPLDGVEITQKHRFLTRSIRLAQSKHLNQLSTLLGSGTVTGNVF